MIKMFKEKATLEEVASLRETTGKNSELVQELYDAIANQKRMIDKIMDYLGVEPVTIITKTGATYPTTETVTTLKKKTAKKPSKIEDDNDD